MVKRVTLRLGDELAVALEREAVRRGILTSAAVREAVEAWVQSPLPRQFRAAAIASSGRSDTSVRFEEILQELMGAGDQ